MKYAVKIVRDVGTRDIMVFPAKQCRNDQQTYRKRTKGVCVELLRVFDTREAAVEAEKAECLAAVLASLSDDELNEKVEADTQFMMKELGMARKYVAKYAGLSPHSLKKCKERGYRHNSRGAARLHYTVEHFRQIFAKLDAILPIDETTGTLRKDARLKYKM